MALAKMGLYNIIKKNVYLSDGYEVCRASHCSRFATVIIQRVRIWDTVGRNCSNTVHRRRYFKQHGPSMARGRSNVELIGRGARERVNK